MEGTTSGYIYGNPRLLMVVKNNHIFFPVDYPTNKPTNKPAKFSWPLIYAFISYLTHNYYFDCRVYSWRWFTFIMQENVDVRYWTSIILLPVLFSGKHVHPRNTYGDVSYRYQSLKWRCVNAPEIKNIPPSKRDVKTYEHTTLWSDGMSTRRFHCVYFR